MFIGGLMDGEIPHSASHKHYSKRSPNLRAALLGANDAVVSVSAIIMAVIAGDVANRILLLTSISAIVGGSLSMAVGEYMSVSTQRDSEKADIKKETEEHAKGPEAQQRELQELTAIYIHKGLPPALAQVVAEELSKGDNVVRIHIMEELGINVDELSSPTKAAFFSGLSFLFGGVFPLFALLFTNKWYRVGAVVAIDTVLFVFFGMLSATLGGSSKAKATVRVLIGGLVALAVTFGVGYLFTVI